MKYAVLFIALLFAGCDEAPSTDEAPYEATSTDGGYETFTIVGETMQVAKEDLPHLMTWDDAMSACQNLGNGWRLPSVGELQEMYELHKQGKGNFKNELYWSSSQDNSGVAWNVSFSDGIVRNYGVNKDFLARVRAVRALP